MFLSDGCCSSHAMQHIPAYASTSPLCESLSRLQKYGQHSQQSCTSLMCERLHLMERGPTRVTKPLKFSTCRQTATGRTGRSGSCSGESEARSMRPYLLKGHDRPLTQVKWVEGKHVQLRERTGTNFRWWPPPGLIGKEISSSPAPRCVVGFVQSFKAPRHSWHAHA